MEAVRTNEVATRGSSINLTCHGRKVESHDTTVQWKFNGSGIQGNTNKKAISKFLANKEGSFLLYIKNVSEKDVGRYACLARVAGSSREDDVEDHIELSLYKKGEFYLLLLL